MKNFDKFHNAGYKGIYNGETVDDIAKRRNLRYREDILDNMEKDIRTFIERLCGSMKEDLPTPEKSLKQIEKETKNNLIKKA